MKNYNLQITTNMDYYLTCYKSGKPVHFGKHSYMIHSIVSNDVIGMHRL